MLLEKCHPQKGGDIVIQIVTRGVKIFVSIKCTDSLSSRFGIIRRGCSCSESGTVRVTSIYGRGQHWRCTGVDN
jgi:hypothetical protein